MNEVQEKTKDDIINEEIEAEHALTDEEKAKLAKEAEKVELAEGETIDEGVSDEETLSKAIQASMSEKKQEFLAEMSKNPNKRLYSSRITLEFAELIEVDKTQLRYEENEDDYKFNNDLMKSKTTDFGFDLLQLATKIQNTKNCSIEQIKYAGRPYQKKCNCGPDIKVEAIGIENAPKAVQDFVNNLKNLSNCSCDACDD